MTNLLQKSQMFLGRNASTILTCIGGVGVLVTAVMAAKATPKAMTRLALAEEEKGEELTKLEKVQVAAPSYIPAIVTGVSTVACIFGANILNQRHQAALMSAYALLDSSYRDYKKKVDELYGNEAGAEVRAAIAKDKYDEDDIQTTPGLQLFYDDFSGRYFESTMEKVISAKYELSRTLSLQGAVFLNEFYEALDIPATDYGEYLGWSSGSLYDYQWSDWLDINLEKTTIDDDLECYIITFGVEPMFDFEYY
jgi:hypothetical protein